MVTTYHQSNIKLGEITGLLILQSRCGYMVRLIQAKFEPLLRHFSDYQKL